MPFSPKFNTSYSTFVTLMRVSHLFWVSDLLFEFCVFYSSFIHLFKLSTFYKSFMPFPPMFNTYYIYKFVTLTRVSHLFWVSDLLFEFHTFIQVVYLLLKFHSFIRVLKLLIKFHIFYSSSIPFSSLVFYIGVVYLLFEFHTFYWISYLLFELCTFYLSFLPHIRVSHHF